MTFKRGQLVEFCTSVTCRVLSPVGSRPSLKVSAGTLGKTYPDEFFTFPGDVPVLITVVEPDGYQQKIVISALEGHLAPLRVEFDSHSNSVVKHYRGTSEIVEDSTEFDLLDDDFEMI